MNKFYKFAGLILLVVTVTLFTKSTEAKAYTYENWKDSVVNDDGVDLWENHYDIFASKDSTIWDKTIHKTSLYNAEVLNLSINKGTMRTLPGRNLLTLDNRNLQLTTFNATGIVTYKSHNEKVCTVDQSGKVTIGSHTGATIVEATDSKGNRSGVLILAVTGNSSQWFEDMFTRAYYGCDFVDYTGLHDIEEAVTVFNVYVEDGGRTSKIELIKKISDLPYNKLRWRFEDANCQVYTGYCLTYISPFFNITGKEGVSSAGPYISHIAILGYIDNQFFWLDNCDYRPINENGGEKGNLYGFESGYKHTVKDGIHTFSVASIDDCMIGDYYERDTEYTFSWLNWVK